MVSGRRNGDNRPRICYCCNTNESLDKYGYAAWFENHGTDSFLCMKCNDWIRKVNGKQAYQKMMREKLGCYSCGTIKSKKSNGQAAWYYNYNKQNEIIHTMCQRCHIQIFKEPYRIRFRLERPYVEEALRKGECSLCKKTVYSGQIKVTNIHHEEYIPERPNEHTIEICAKHHAILHTILRRIEAITRQEQCYLLSKYVSV